MVLKLPFGRIVRRADNTLDIASFQTRFSFLTIFWFLVSGNLVSSFWSLLSAQSVDESVASFWFVFCGFWFVFRTICVIWVICGSVQSFLAIFKTKIIHRLRR
jgi:hypothetical protein